MKIAGFQSCARDNFIASRQRQRNTVEPQLPEKIRCRDSIVACAALQILLTFEEEDKLLPQISNNCFLNIKVKKKFQIFVVGRHIN